MKPHSDASQHSIRLHGPWSLASVTGDGSLVSAGQPSVQISFPFKASELRHLSSERIETSSVPTAIGLVRPFRVPTGLTPEQQVWLKIDSCLPSYELLLSPANWQCEENTEVEITNLLASRAPQAPMLLGIKLEFAMLKALNEETIVFPRCELQIRSASV